MPVRRIVWLAKILFSLSILLLVGRASAEEPPLLKTPRDKVNYSIGVNLISNFRQQGVDIDLDLVIKGMRDAFSGGKYLLSDEDIRIAIQQYQITVRQKRSQALANAAIEARKAGEAFLARNKTAEGVLSLPSGVQYRVLKAGDGRKPTDTDTVEVKYRGTLVNGREFDASPTGRTASFKVGAAIPGWAEALQLMPAGSKWQIFLPARLAYGEQGKSGFVGPNEVVILETELLAIK